MGIFLLLSNSSGLACIYKSDVPVMVRVSFDLELVYKGKAEEEFFICNIPSSCIASIDRVSITSSPFNYRKYSYLNKTSFVLEF